MRTFEDWMTEYGKDHKNPVNQKIHVICVPLILFSILGLLWKVQWPSGDGQSLLNGATTLTFFSLLFYVRLNIKYAIGMALFVLPMLYLMSVVALYPYYTSAMALIFILAWVGQFIGHKIEGQKPSFLTDLQFLMIGPLWVLKKIVSPLV